MHCLSFLGVASLLSKKAVCKTLKKSCIQAIDLKYDNQKAFEIKEELKKAVDKHCFYGASSIEDIASVVFQSASGMFQS